VTDTVALLSWNLFSICSWYFFLYAAADNKSFAQIIEDWVRKDMALGANAAAV